jgi:hypothetical protein
MRHFPTCWTYKPLAAAFAVACMVVALLFAVGLETARAADLTGVWERPAQKGQGVDPRQLNPKISPAPLNSRFAPIYAADQARRNAAADRGEPLPTDKALCLPDGMPTMLATALPVEILQTPGKVTMIAEFGTQVRHIDLGAAGHPGPDDLEYNFFGDSIGRWDGDTLVVDTVGVHMSTLLFDYVPHGERLRITERYRLLDPNLLEIRITMEDSEYFTEPWTVTRMFARQPGMKLREYVCENQRNFTDAQGKIGTVLKPN